MSIIGTVIRTGLRDLLTERLGPDQAPRLC